MQYYKGLPAMLPSANIIKMASTNIVENNLRYIIICKLNTGNFSIFNKIRQQEILFYSLSCDSTNTIFKLLKTRSIKGTGYKPVCMK